MRRKLDLDRPVEIEVIEECLRLAIQAPTPGNAQQWRWLVIRDQETKNEIGALFREVGDAYMRNKVVTLDDAAKEPATVGTACCGGSRR